MSLRVQRDQSLRRAWEAAGAVADPELPFLTLADLGVLREIEVEGNVAHARVSPTYTGCPAALAIELAVEAALREAGFEARVERVLAPPWTTDWITPTGRAKLKSHGIAPPPDRSAASQALFAHDEVACPRCSSGETERISQFGSTACKALYRCRGCGEPFDYFKCI